MTFWCMFFMRVSIIKPESRTIQISIQILLMLHPIQLLMHQRACSLAIVDEEESWRT